MKRKILKLFVCVAVMAMTLPFTACRSSDDTKTDQTGAKAEENFETTDDSILEGDIFTDTGDGLEAAQPKDVEEDTQVTKEKDPGEAMLTNSTFVTEMKLNREQVREKNKETLLGIINSANLTDEQKQSAVAQMVSLTDIAEREVATEMLLKANGFTDVVVSITDNVADVVINMGDETDTKRAQIEDIVARKTNIKRENIVITPIEF